MTDDGARGERDSAPDAIPRLTPTEPDPARLSQVDGLAEREPAEAGVPGMVIGLVGADGPEDVRFDAVVDGRPLRAWLSGYPYHRVG